MAAGFLIIRLRNVRYIPAFVFSITSRVIDAIQSGVQLGRVERRITMSICNLKSILTDDAVTCTGVFAISLLAAAPLAALLRLPSHLAAVAARLGPPTALQLGGVGCRQERNAPMVSHD